jgi:hypothetical protein
MVFEWRRVALMLAGSVLVSVTCCAPSAAGAAGEPPICGTTPSGGGPAAKATLALADQDPETVAGATYGRDTGERQMTLVYTASGCRLADDLPAPLDPPPIGPPKDQTLDTVPYGVIRLNGSPDIDGNQYIVHLTVSTSPAAFKNQDGKEVQPSFDPGTYAGFLHLRAPWLHRVGTPVAISRSDNQWLKVAVLASIGALAGFVGFALLHWFAQADLLVGTLRFAFAGAASVVIGGGTAYLTNYLNQGVWTFGANGRALVFAAFTAATTGPVVTGLLTKVYDDKKAVTDAVKEAKDTARTSAAREMASGGEAPE